MGACVVLFGAQSKEAAEMKEMTAEKCKRNATVESEPENTARYAAVQGRSLGRRYKFARDTKALVGSFLELRGGQRPP